MIIQSRWVRACVVQAVCVACAWAVPEDDYQRGLQAYHRGDVATAMSLLRVPADAGHAPSQSLLAFILERADLPEEAARLYRRAAAQGDAEAQAGLASLYLTGRGIAKDEKLALLYFSKAAESGHALAIQVLADAHLSGSMGLRDERRDNSRTVSVLKRAAEQGHLPSIEALAEAYRVGGLGLHADAEQAAHWSARGAELRGRRAGPAPKGKP